MSAKQIHLNTGTENPILYQFDEKGMAALFVMIRDSVREVVKEEMSLATEKPMTAADVAKFLGVTVQTVRVQTRQGILPSHELSPGSLSPHRRYYASEINEKIKGKR